MDSKGPDDQDSHDTVMGTDDSGIQSQDIAPLGAMAPGGTSPTDSPPPLKNISDDDENVSLEDYNETDKLNSEACAAGTSTTTVPTMAQNQEAAQGAPPPTVNMTVENQPDQNPDRAHIQMRMSAELNAEQKLHLQSLQAEFAQHDDLSCDLTVPACTVDEFIQRMNSEQIFNFTMLNDDYVIARPDDLVPLLRASKTLLQLWSP